MEYEPIITLAERLAHDAEAVCRHYLSNGYRAGRYWQVGDARNAPGRSTYVRLHSTAKGPAGKWTDAATGEHGDLLDIIRECRGLHDFKDVADEARRFLSLPAAERPEPATARRAPAPQGSPEAARRLIAISKPIAGTIAQAYLRKRGITDLRDTDSLHFHPKCYYRPMDTGPTETWPAMVASVTDLMGRITGAHRTWLDRAGRGKRRSTHRDGRWETFSATRCALGPALMSLQQAKESRRSFRSGRPCPECRRSPDSPQHI